MSETRVSVVVTGTAWMGSGIGSIESALERLLREAEHEIALTVYAIGSGADLLLDWLEAALARGVQVKLVVNRLRSQPPDVTIRLRQFATMYPHLLFYDFAPESETDLHAKVVVVDRRLALVGSSNLSRRGLLSNQTTPCLRAPRTALRAGSAGG